MRTFKNAISYRFFNGGGKGGQHGNRSLTAVEAVLDPKVAIELGMSNMSATSVSFKSQRANKLSAGKVIRSKIRIALRIQLTRKRFAAGRDRVRNYHGPDDRVTDSGGVYSYRKTVGKGDLSTVIDRLRDRMVVRIA